jgi:hypothetical protein
MKMNLGGILVLAASLFTLRAQAAWRQVLSCDGGAAVVDADQDNPYLVQLVIREKAIVDYFRSSGFGASPGVPFQGSEIIVSGRNDQPVYSGGDVRSFSAQRPSSYSNTEYSYVRREGAGLRINTVDRHNGCPGECRDYPYSMQCESLCTGAQVGSQWDVANWYFQNCQ